MCVSLSKLRSFAPRRSLLAAGGAVLVAVAVTGSPSAGAETLEAVTSRALLESPKLKADQARQDATRQELSATRAAILLAGLLAVDVAFGAALALSARVMAHLLPQKHPQEG